jgi:hypothetical protein
MAEPFDGAHWQVQASAEDEDALFRDQDWSDHSSDFDDHFDNRDLDGDANAEGDGDGSSASAEDVLIVTPHKDRYGYGRSGRGPLDELERSRIDAEMRLRDAEDRLKAFKEGMYWLKGGEKIPRFEGELQGWKDVLTGRSGFKLARWQADRGTRALDPNKADVCRPRCCFPGPVIGNGADVCRSEWGR